MSNNPCRTCQATGLPVLPCRYTVIPQNFPVPRADPLGVYSGERVKDVAISDRYRYAVRTLRAGFLYLFYESGPQGSNYWEAYAVTEAGELWKAADAQSVQGAVTKACSSQGGHNALRMQYLVIEKPEQCGKVWLAYSEHKWSDKTLDRYKDAAIRAKRMQPIEPAKWITGAVAANHQEIYALDSNLKSALEYFSDHELVNGEPKELPFKGAETPPTISHANGTHVDAVMRMQSTRHAWHLRNTAQGDQKDKVLEQLHNQMMDKCGDPSMGVEYWPMGIALWDAIGLTDELNGYYSDALGALARYSDERKLEITAAANIRGAKVVLETRAADRADQAADRVREGIRVGDRGQDIRVRNAVIESYFPTMEGKQAMAQLERRRATGEIDAATYQREREQVFAQHLPADKRGEAGQAFDIYHTDLERQQAELDGRLDQHKQSEIAGAWPRYEDNINWDKLNAFERQYEVFQRTIKQLADYRAQDLIKWLESPLLWDTLEDYHGEDPDDGEEFAEVVGDLIEGLGSCPSGEAYLTMLVTQRTDPTQPGALFWRAIAANQDELRKELAEGLAQAQAKKDESISGAGGFASVVALLNSFKKYANYYKASLGRVHQKDPSKIPPWNRVLKNVGFDKLVVTCGDKVFSYLRINNLADYVGEKVIQHLFLVRGGVPDVDSLNLVKLQAQHEGLNRAQTLARIRTARTLMEANEAIVRQPGSVALTEMWSRVRPIEARQQITNMRIGVAVGFVEVANLIKMVSATDKKGKDYAQIVASIASLSAAIIEIGIVPYHLLGAKRAMGFQIWKLRGAALSGIASFINAGIDFAAARQAAEENKLGVATLYYVKFAVGVGTIGNTLLLATVASAPFIKKLGEKTGVRILVFVGTNVSRWAAAAALARVLGMIAGWKVTIVVTGIQILVWYFTPDDLEEWCETSAFGNQTFGKPFTDAKLQEEKFAAALESVG